MGGVARRNWARNTPAMDTATAWNEKHKDDGAITIPAEIDEAAIDALLAKSLKE